MFSSSKHTLPKYPNSRRVNRATKAGYWKSTGRDRKIKTRRTKEEIGTKKTLVFHEGRVPDGIKTKWIIHGIYNTSLSLPGLHGMRFLVVYFYCGGSGISPVTFCDYMIFFYLNVNDMKLVVSKFKCIEFSAWFSIIGLCSEVLTCAECSKHLCQKNPVHQRLQA